MFPPLLFTAGLLLTLAFLAFFSARAPFLRGVSNERCMLRTRILLTRASIDHPVGANQIESSSLQAVLFATVEPSSHGRCFSDVTDLPPNALTIQPFADFLPLLRLFA